MPPERYTALDRAPSQPELGHGVRNHFNFRDGYINLNHGSFGSYSTVVRNAVHEWQDRIEESPDQFLRFDYLPAITSVRSRLAKLVNCLTDELVFVQNATSGINTILRSINFGEGDTILHLSTVYGAVDNTIQYIVDTRPGVKAHCIHIEYPISHDAILEKVEEALKTVPGIKLGLFDCITSLPGVRVPWERLVQLLRQHNVLSLIDAAHGIGHLPLNLHASDPDFFISNCHKWLFSIRGTAILYVPFRNQHLIHGNPTGHGYIPKSKRVALGSKQEFDSDDFVREFEFPGTIDFSPFLAIDAALDYRRSIGGETRIMEYCQQLALQGGLRVAHILDTDILEADPCCMINVKLPLKGIPADKAPETIRYLYEEMLSRFNCFASCFYHAGHWWARLSAQVYLDITDFEYVGNCLEVLCKELQSRVDHEISDAKEHSIVNANGIEKLKSEGKLPDFQNHVATLGGPEKIQKLRSMRDKAMEAES